MKTIYKVNLILVILMLMAISLLIVYKFYSEKIGLAVRSEETKNEYLLEDDQGNITSVTKEEWDFAHNLEIAAVISGCILFVTIVYFCSRYIWFPMLKHNIRKTKDFLAKIK
ncbi:MAG: hypothetical protein J6X67_10100 [Treponema sp.]|nr:hypothetical protein [Treponema sp.]